MVSVPTSAPALTNAVALLPACIRQPVRSSGSIIDLSALDAAQAVVSVLPAKPVCIGQPVRSSGYGIDLSASGVAQAVASMSPAKVVSIRQPAPCSSGSVIDLSASDVALAVASALPAKPVFIGWPAPCSFGSVVDLSAPDAALAVASIIDIAGIDAVEENHVLANQNLVLAIVVGQLKSREQEATYRCRALEELLDQEWLDNRSQRFVTHDLETRLANNNANLISELREHITFLEEWSEWRHSDFVPGNVFLPPFSGA